MANVFTPNLAATRNQRIVLADYIIGTVAATNGSAAVVGTSTVWSAENAGMRIVINGVEYQIESVADPLNLTLSTPFGESTASGLTYAIRDSFLSAPINAAAGTWLTIIEQDATGGHNLILDSAIYFHDVDILGTAAPSTRSQVGWLLDQSGFNSLLYVTANQPIPS